MYPIKCKCTADCDFYNLKKGEVLYATVMSDELITIDHHGIEIKCVWEWFIYFFKLVV